MVLYWLPSEADLVEANGHHAADAAPNDDLPKLVLADWLDEHAEADRA